ncbi:MAG: sigma-70 family RNA polymerase sigma factor [Candidatus Riflebacteria bacterium]|nr:sigma-70 family RNA polymerase sigma factor [Candidatus Riflebacteria bacterium]
MSSKEKEILLAERLRNRDEGAFNDVVREYSAKVIRQARILLGSWESAEDAAQEALLKAFNHMHEIRGEKIGPWLAGIVYHHCLDILRAKKKLPLSSSLPDDDLLEDKSTPFRNGEWEVLNSLSAKEHQVIVLRIVENLDYSEISDVTGLAAGTLRNLFSNALKKIRDEVMKRGL